MPPQRCQRSGVKGWRWGTSGKCFTGKGAKAKAERQGRAIEAAIATRNAMRRLGVIASVAAVDIESLCACGLVANRTKIVPSNPLKADPTRTKTLRRVLEAEFVRRFRELRRKVIDLVVVEDAFGLKRRPINTPFTGNEENEDALEQNSERPVGGENVELKGANEIGGGSYRAAQPDESDNLPTRDVREGSAGASGGSEESRDGGTSRTVAKRDSRRAHLTQNEERDDGPDGIENTDERDGQTVDPDARRDQPELPEAGRRDKGENDGIGEGSRRVGREDGQAGGEDRGVDESHGSDGEARGQAVLHNRQTHSTLGPGEDNGGGVECRDADSDGDESPSQTQASDPERTCENRQVNRELRTQNQRFAFRSSAEQVRLFQEWLAAEIQLGVIQTTAANVENAYWTEFIRRGYEKGAGRAFDDVRKPALASGKEQLAFFDGTRAEFLRQSFAQPETVEKVKLLAGRVFTELKGVTDAMSAQMSRALAEGLVQGKNPRAIAKDLVDRVDKIGINRARLIARTEIIRAHAEGQLDAMERLGVEEVGVMVEWSTAGDDRVCPLCQPLEGVVFKLKEARGLIPRHPQCVAGDTVIIAEDASHIMSAKYTGEIVDFTTAFGSRFSVTSHHILLTQRGWVFAQDISDADYLINASCAYGHPIAPHDYLRHPTASQVFGAAVKVSDESRITETLSMPEYLHGDGISVDSKIKIVDIQSILRNERQTLGNRHSVEAFLDLRHIPAGNAPSLYSFGDSSFVLNRLANAADSFMRSLGITHILKARSVFHHKPIGLSVIPDMNPAFVDMCANASPPYVEPFAERIFAEPLAIEFKDLIGQHLVPIKKIDSRHVSSLPVFDVSTDSTLYTIAGVLSSNCRCAHVPANVGENTRGQKRGASAVKAARDRSVKAEIPKRSKRTVAQQKRRSTWAGADKKIAKKRPRSEL